MVDGAGAGRGARGGDRARAARALHRELAGEPEERLDHPHGRLRPRGLRRAPPRSGTGAPSTCGWCCERWAEAVPPERVHVLPARPRARPATTSGSRFAGVVGVDPDGVDLSGVASPTPRWAWSRPRRCAGSTSASSGFDRAFDKGVYIRTFLADERLVPRGGRALLARARPGRGVPPARPRGRRATCASAASTSWATSTHLLVPDELEPTAPTPVGDRRRGGRRGRRPGRAAARRPQGRRPGLRLRAGGPPGGDTVMNLPRTPRPLRPCRTPSRSGSRDPCRAGRGCGGWCRCGRRRSGRRR